MTLNGRNLSDNGDTQYVDQPGPGIDSHLLWDVTGTTNVPTFTYDYTGTYPSYTGPQLPDTITRANGFTMNFPANTYTAGAFVQISFDEFGRFLFKEMDNSGTVSFTAAEMGQLHDDMNMANIIICDTSYRTFSGKQYYFAKERIYMGNVFLK